MNDDHINLMKTLCAYRWILLLGGNAKLAKIVEENMKFAEEFKPCAR